MEPEGQLLIVRYVVDDPAARAAKYASFNTGGRSRPRVLLTTEGTYPHYAGGSSTWCDLLIKQIPEADFIVWSLMMNPFIKQQFEFPPNVVQFVGLPLWGVEQPAEYTREIPSGRVYERARRTNEAEIERHFLPRFDAFIESVTNALFDPDDFAASLVDLQEYFRNWDYRTTWRSQVVWEAFKEKLGSAPRERLTAEDIAAENAPRSRWERFRGSMGYLLKGDGDNELDDYDENAPRDLEAPATIGEAVEGLRWIYRLLQTLSVEVPAADVTHSAAAAFCAIPCILAKAENNIPFLLTEHGVYLREQYLAIERFRYPYNLKRFLMDLISAVAQTSYRFADQVSPVCAYNARWERAYGVDDERIQVIYNGVDKVEFSPRGTAMPANPTVSVVGRIDPLKDLETTLRVAEAVRQVIPNVKFEHYGNVADDEYDETVKELWKDLKLEKTVTFNGPTKDVAGVHADSHLMLQTSISEAFPYSVVEAMMCARPVVSTSVGGVSEALGSTGALAPPRDVPAIADAVIELLTLPPDELRRRGQESRDRALEHFTLEKFTDEYRETYFRLAENEPVVVYNRRPSADVEGAEVAYFGDTGTEDAFGAPIDEPEAAWSPPGAEPLPAPGAATSYSRHYEPEELRDVLASDDPFERVSALRRAAGDEDLQTVASEALKDASPTVRREALQLLARIGSPLAARQLSEVAVSDPSPEIREAAIAALTQLARQNSSNNPFEAGAGA